MATLAIHELGSRALRMRARKVEEITPDIRRLVDDLFDTMRSAGGVGLAANQVGMLARVLVVEVPRSDRKIAYALINPKIVESSPETETEVEGCLSVPGLEEPVTRPARVEVQALTPEGDSISLKAEGLLARALQHEVDHLDGVLFFDRMSPLKRSLALKRWRRRRALESERP